MGGICELCRTMAIRCEETETERRGGWGEKEKKQEEEEEEESLGDNQERMREAEVIKRPSSAGLIP
ncbi:hypothetical protein E2C01_092582 [Portunus trituberculatus]|uniref:Uncharacterized protein n=1 Tax=Portunus trituberculatus TaxID=210409 RepID=A0A5B7JVU1_PORTR|nr:hypothetical protein [Portunus trituberculatus]